MKTTNSTKKVLVPQRNSKLTPIVKETSLSQSKLKSTPNKNTALANQPNQLSSRKSSIKLIESFKTDLNHPNIETGINPKKEKSILNLPLNQLQSEKFIKSSASQRTKLIPKKPVQIIDQNQNQKHIPPNSTAKTRSPCSSNNLSNVNSPNPEESTSKIPVSRDSFTSIPKTSIESTENGTRFLLFQNQSALESIEKCNQAEIHGFNPGKFVEITESSKPSFISNFLEKSLLNVTQKSDVISNFDKQRVIDNNCSVDVKSRSFLIQKEAISIIQKIMDESNLEGLGKKKTKSRIDDLQGQCEKLEVRVLKQGFTLLRRFVSQISRLQKRRAFKSLQIIFKS